MNVIDPDGVPLSEKESWGPGRGWYYGMGARPTFLDYGGS